MRRALTALTLAAALGLTACGSDGEPTAAPTTGAEAAPTSAEPSVTADYTEDTKKVCGEVEKVLDNETKGFATELGKMLAYRQAKKAAEADKARAATQREMKDFAASMREKTSTALDPELKAAGEESAAAIEKTASDTAFFNGIKSVKDIDDVFEKEMTVWLTPLGTFCE